MAKNYNHMLQSATELHIKNMNKTKDKRRQRKELGTAALALSKSQR